MFICKAQPFVFVLTISTVFFAISVPAWAQRTYVGPDACANCHVDHPGWTRSGAHENLTLTLGGGDAASGCEACHGPGSEHAENLSKESIITFNNEPAEQRSAQCLACHGGSQPTLNFLRSDHRAGKVACDQCHTASGSESFHRMRVVEEVLSDQQPGLCFQCHAEQRVEFSMPFRHPVAEGFMQCSSCHQPHGSFNLRQLRSRGTEHICGECHQETQGPFVFQHPTGRTLGCEGCHRPHGATNAKMLTRHQVRFLCLECHANTSFSHDLTQTRYQNCTLCHSRIHGSNLNRLLFR